MDDTLENTPVFLFDCQATGPCSAGGHILELGWCIHRADEPEPPDSSKIETHAVRLPEAASIPVAVEKITGIDREDPADAISPAAAWRRFRKAAKIGKTRPLCVIHYARFEIPYLHRLHRDFGSGDFPLPIVCTHEMARRLLPHLPRKGLRALAGYFGHPVSPLRRSAHHVAATAVIWRCLVALLQQQMPGITSDGLLKWLQQPAVRPGVTPLYPMEKKIRTALPDESGVYRMLRSDGSVLYVGKAASLKKRVNSYFTKKKGHAEHILEMLTQARDLSYVSLPSALEAALLESDEIKRLSPPYNIALQNDERSVGFVSPDLKVHSPLPENRCSLGPLPSETALKPLSLLADMLFRKQGAPIESEAEMETILGFSKDRLPSLECFDAGLACFAERNGAILHKRPRNWWEILGARFWREAANRRETEPDSDTDPDASDGESPPQERVWMPGLVADALESVVRRSAHLVRRGRWFCLLSESILIWSRPDGRRDGLMLQGGVVQRRLGGAEGPLERVFPEFVPGCRQRLQRMDVAAYDRLRVTTTELRRLLKQERKVALTVGRGRVLGNDRLADMLRWV